MENMILTAHSLGLGTCWVGAFDEDELWDSLNAMMDLENFIDGWVYEIYTAKGDPTSNARIWRPRRNDAERHRGPLATPDLIDRFVQRAVTPP